jgi:hypothetical protein
MKTTFYGVISEFYETETLAEKVVRTACKEPKNQFRQTFGQTAFILWMENEKEADDLVRRIKNKAANAHCLMQIYNGMVRERRAA